MTQVEIIWSRPRYTCVRRGWIFRACRMWSWGTKRLDGHVLCKGERRQTGQCASYNGFILNIWKMHFQRGLQQGQVFGGRKEGDQRKESLCLGMFLWDAYWASTWNSPEDSGRQRKGLEWRYKPRTLLIDSVTPVIMCTHCNVCSLKKKPSCYSTSPPSAAQFPWSPLHKALK